MATEAAIFFTGVMIFAGACIAGGAIYAGLEKLADAINKKG